MALSDWLTIIAILLAPVFAVQVQKWVEHLRERRGKKLGVFQALMATRGARLSPEHVRALNMIDLEFSGEGQLEILALIKVVEISAFGRKL